MRGQLRQATGRLLLVAFLCGEAGAAQAGAWTQKESQGLAFVQTTATWSSAAFAADGSLFAARSYDKVSTQLFLEYGASDWLTLLAAPELLTIKTGAGMADGLAIPAARYSGFGYQEIGARFRFGEGESWIVSAQALLRIPGAKPAAGPATIGYADAEIDLRLMAGLTFALFGYPAFLDLEAAQRLREGAAPDEIRLDATLGVRVAPDWQVLVQSFNVISEGAGQPPFDVSYAYYKVQVGGMVDLTPTLSLMLAGVSTWYARNAIQENGIVGGMLVRY